MPVGDPESTVKLFELYRARFTEQLKKSFHKYLIVEYYRSNFKILTLFGATDTWKRVFHD